MRLISLRSLQIKRWLP